MSGKLLYGSIGIAHYNAAGKGDSHQLIFKSVKDGFEAMRQLLFKQYSNGAIEVAFAKYQKSIEGFRSKLNALRKKGIDPRRSFGDLSTSEQDTFMNIWIRFEGWKKGKISKGQGVQLPTAGQGGFAGVMSLAKSTVSNISSSIGSNFGSFSAGVSSAALANTFAPAMLTGTDNASAMVEDARTFTNGKYSYSQDKRGINLQTGAMLAGATSFDCSSFVAMMVAKYYGIPANVFGTWTQSQYDYCAKSNNAVNINPKNIQPGDIIFYNHTNKHGVGRPTHVTIASKPGYMIHARGKKQGIQESAFSTKNLLHIFRLNKKGTTNIVTGRSASISAAGATGVMVQGMGYVPNGSTSIKNINTEITTVQEQIQNLQNQIIHTNKEDKEKSGFFGVIDANACTI